MEEQLENENPNVCGGVPKPPPKEGSLGDWVCTAGNWVWEDA